MEITARKLTPDGVPAILRLVIDAATHVSDDIWFQTKVLKQAMSAIVNADFDCTAAELAFEALSETKKLFGRKDPYEQAKQAANQVMLSLLPVLRQLSESLDEDPLSGAIRVAAAATAIDFPDVEEAAALRVQLTDLVGRAAPVDDTPTLRDAIKGAKSVLYLLDRAGELVADRVLIETLAGKEVTCVVRRGPILGCATADDAVAVGLDSLAKVINPGAAMLGIVRSLATKRFVQNLMKADVVIAKGPDNFETLAGMEREIFFLFKPRTQTDAKDLGVPFGDWLVVQHVPAEVTARNRSPDA